MRSVKVYEEAWPLHTPFVISRGSRSEASVVVVEIEEEGFKGVGECTPYPRYGESLASVMAQIMTQPTSEDQTTAETMPCGTEWAAFLVSSEVCAEAS